MDSTSCYCFLVPASVFFNGSSEASGQETSLRDEGIEMANTKSKFHFFGKGLWTIPVDEKKKISSVNNPLACSRADALCLIVPGTVLLDMATCRTHKI